MEPTIYTIGYAGYPDIDDFVRALRDNHVNSLIDVRSSPFSAYYEQYNMDRLKVFLQEKGIVYLSFAKEFGARQDNQAFYRNGRLDFPTFAESETFKSGIERVNNGLKKGFVPVLMCAEKDPIECHRAILISRAFSEAGVAVFHIGPDRMQSHKELEQRLIAQARHKIEREQGKHNIEGQISLIPTEIPEYTMPSDKQLLETAYRTKNDEIGFKESELGK